MSATLRQRWSIAELEEQLNRPNERTVKVVGQLKGDILILGARGKISAQRFCGGLLGHWAVWTSRAVELIERCQQYRSSSNSDAVALAALYELAPEVTDMNAAIFDAAHDFRGCLPGIHEVLRRQGLLANNYCLDKGETLSPGQAEEIDRVTAAYPQLQDDAWVAENLDCWLRD